MNMPRKQTCFVISNVIILNEIQGTTWKYLAL